MAWKVKALAPNPGDPTSTSGSHMVERERTGCLPVVALTHTLINKIEKMNLYKLGDVSCFHFRY